MSERFLAFLDKARALRATDIHIRIPALALDGQTSKIAGKEAGKEAGREASKAGDREAGREASGAADREEIDALARVRLGVSLRIAGEIASSKIELYIDDIDFILSPYLEVAALVMVDDVDMYERLASVRDFSLLYPYYIRVNVAEASPSSHDDSSYTRQTDILLAIRLLNKAPLPISSLKLPSALGSAIDKPSGLILITGATSSGKSTTMQSLLDYINKTKKKHIILLQDPVEFDFLEDRSIISNIAIGRDAPSYTAALHSALRQDPDIIAIAEIRSLDELKAALLASELGHLVIATIHASSAVGTLLRISAQVEARSRDFVLYELANSLELILTQELISCKDGSLVAAYELLLNTKAIAALIRENKIHQIQLEIQEGSMSMRQYKEMLRGRGLIG